MSTQINLFNKTQAKKPVKERTSESILSQIRILERKVVSLVAEGNSTQRIFALNGKIQKLKFELVERKNFEWLAK